MIKLIATDLDGTLLRSDKSLPDGFMQTARRLMDDGITFVAASGRQYDNIYQTLYPLSERMYIISENGAINGYGSQVREEMRMTEKSVRQVLDFVRASGGRANAICCCAHEGRYTSDEPEFVREMSRYYLRRRRVGESEMNASPACKIALYCYGKSEELYRTMPTFEGLTNVVSGTDWVDVAPDGINKGKALESILRETGIRPEECVAFGDNFNDKEMLELCGRRYTVSNAPEGMRRMFPCIGSNDDGAVFAEIRRIFDL